MDSFVTYSLNLNVMNPLHKFCATQRRSERQSENKMKSLLVKNIVSRYASAACTFAYGIL